MSLKASAAVSNDSVLTRDRIACSFNLSAFNLSAFSLSAFRSVAERVRDAVAESQAVPFSAQGPDVKSSVEGLKSPVYRCARIRKELGSLRHRLALLLHKALLFYRLRCNPRSSRVRARTGRGV